MVKSSSGNGGRRKPASSRRVKPNATTSSLNAGLSAAKAAKKDEFYTQFIDIQKEVEAYLEYDPDTFCDKIVYCNCDDPFESNFFKYFAANFNKLGLKQLITTSYDGSPIAGRGTLFEEYNQGNGQRRKPKSLAVTLNHVKDEDGDGAANINDVELFLKRNKAARRAFKGDYQYPGGDFRSAECVELLKQADIVVTNPPFSLFREYVAQLVKHEKKFILIGPKNAITYKEIFPLIKANELWLGSGFANGNAFFSIPTHENRKFAAGVYDPKTGLVKFRNVGWFTNIDHGRRHEKLPLMTTEENLRYSKHKKVKGKAAYDQYDNYNAIEVPYVDAIPSDHNGAMGVPITVLDKYNPEQFEILGITDRDDNSGLKTKEYSKEETPNANDLNRRAAIRDGDELKSTYARILIRHRKTRRSKRTKK